MGLCAEKGMTAWFFSFSLNDFGLCGVRPISLRPTSFTFSFRRDGDMVLSTTSAGFDLMNIVEILKDVGEFVERRVEGVGGKAVGKAGTK